MIPWKTLFDFVKFEHTLFSLPVILAGAVLAAEGWPPFGILTAILVAGTGARTTALALNRILDREIDARNPRTKGRELPSGKLTLQKAWGVAFGGLVLYAGGLAFLPPICAKVSIVPLAVFVIYPLMKRFTMLAHYGVGLGLGLAPVAAAIAVRGSFQGIESAVWLGLFTWLWVAGFDIIYATLDEEFDRSEGLHSIPGKLGRRAALQIAAGTHLVSFLCLAWMTFRYVNSPLALIALGLVGALLAIEHHMAHRVELAFFHVNAALGFVVLALILVGI